MEKIISNDPNKPKPACAACLGVFTDDSEIIKREYTSPLDLKEEAYMHTNCLNLPLKVRIKKG